MPEPADRRLETGVSGRMSALISMRKKLIPLVAVALGVAGIATVLLYGLIADRFGPSPGAKAATQIIVAARAIDRGKVLEHDDLKALDAPCPQGGSKACFGAPDAVIGRTALQPVLQGQPLLAALLSAPQTGASPSAAIPVGYRAVTIHPADSSGVIGMLRSGDRVDLQVIDADRSVPHAPLTVQKVWPDVEVLQVLPPDPASVWAQRPVVTVLLAPREAGQVGLSDTTGRIRLVLRNRDESAKNIPVAAPPAEPAPVPPAEPTGGDKPAPEKQSTGKPAAAGPPVAKTAEVDAPKPPEKKPEETGPQYRVRLVSVNPEALGDLGAGEASLQPKVEAQNLIQIEQALAHLQKDKSAQVIAERPLLAAAAPHELILEQGALRFGPADHTDHAVCFHGRLHFRWIHTADGPDVADVARRVATVR